MRSFIAVHLFAGVLAGESSLEGVGYLVVLGSVTLAYKSRILIAELVEDFIIQMALRALIVSQLHVGIVYDLFYISNSAILVMVVIAAEYNCVLGRFGLFAPLAYIIPG